MMLYFARQEGITADNFRSVVEDLASKVETLDVPAFDDCLDRDTSLGIIVRDRQLAVTLGVRGTPTLFINGETLTGLPDASELHRRLADAINDAADRPVSPANDGR